MFPAIKNGFSRSKAIVAGVAVGALALAGQASAGGSFTAIDMGAIVFPITPASIALSVVTAGATILAIVFAWKGGFKLVWSLLRRLLGVI